MGGIIQQATFKLNLAEFGVIEKTDSPIRITHLSAKFIKKYAINVNVIVLIWLCTTTNTQSTNSIAF